MPMGFHLWSSRAHVIEECILRVYRQHPATWHLTLHPSTVECVLPLKPVEGVVVPGWPHRKAVTYTLAALPLEAAHADSNTAPPGSG